MLATPSDTSSNAWQVLGLLSGLPLRGRVQVGMLQAASHSCSAAVKALPDTALMNVPAADTITNKQRTAADCFTACCSQEGAASVPPNVSCDSQ
jgi:hypothetical protein